MTARLALVLSLLPFVATPASAQDAGALAQELAAQSELVLAGDVLGIDSRWDGAAIYSYVTLSVTRQLKGAPVPARVVLKQLGGQVGTTGLRIDGQAAFVPGDTVLVFLTVRPRDGSLYTQGLGAGKWRVLTDLRTSEARAVPPAGTGTGMAADGGMGVALDRLQAALAGSPQGSSAFVVDPPELARATPSYTYLPTEGGPPARWHQVDEGSPVQIDFQTPPGGPGGQAELGAAVSRWNGGGTRLQLQLYQSGPVNPPCDYGDTDDGRIRVYFNDPCGELSDANPSLFGVGGGYYTTGDQRTINGVAFQRFTQGYAILNNVGPHLASAACFQDALTHTLGHTVGLGDSGVGGAVMQTTLSCTGANLGADDVAGLRSIYPSIPSGGTPPQPPTSISGVAALNSVNLQWAPATTGGPAASYLIEAGSAPGLANLAVLPVNAPATSLVVNAVPTGVYYVRIRARNLLGTSGPSPDAVVNVGSCEAPGAPTGFSAGVTDTLVNLAWVPPTAGGAVQGYTLSVGSAPGLANILVQPLPASPPTFTGVAGYGDYYARLAARNVCGTGPATPDLLIRVQPCTTPPGAPTGLAFTRNGNQVTFSWTAGAAPTASRYLLAVGSAPGLSDLLVQPTPNATPSLTAVGPPGTYFVKVLGVNACGSSMPSNEVQVVIP